MAYEGFELFRERLQKQIDAQSDLHQRVKSLDEQFDPYGESRKVLYALCETIEEQQKLNTTIAQLLTIIDADMETRRAV